MLRNYNKNIYAFPFRKIERYFLLQSLSPIIETFCITLICYIEFATAKVEAVLNISKFSIITGFEILLPDFVGTQNDILLGYSKPSINENSFKNKPV